LQKCYEIAPPRVKQFLQAEIDFVISKINPNDSVLDLGCGYGRVAIRLMDKAKKVIGVDISEDNVELAKQIVGSRTNAEFYTMNALDLNFVDNYFDAVNCVQNAISAFNVDPLKLMAESIRVTRKGGSVLFSSYSEKFWNDRLKWFQIQADHGLIGEIDFNLTRNGIIVCKDGFKAITFSAEEFLKLTSHFDVQAQIYEVDNSSIFCEMIVN
jgi:2-polyprenyl-6-hydroxyphenyl methylase/3-demethylubiquinone-9 3-methyltransferase